jgi:hypothetical protein
MRVANAVARAREARSVAGETALHEARKAAETICNVVLRREGALPVLDVKFEERLGLLRKQVRGGERLVPDTIIADFKVLQAYGNFSSHPSTSPPARHQVDSGLRALSAVTTWFAATYLGDPAAIDPPITAAKQKEPTVVDRKDREEWASFWPLQNDEQHAQRLGFGRTWVRAIFAATLHVSRRVVERELREPASGMDLAELTEILRRRRPSVVPAEILGQLEAICEASREILDVDPADRLPNGAIDRLKKNWPPVGKWFEVDYIKAPQIPWWVRVLAFAVFMFAFFMVARSCNSACSAPFPGRNTSAPTSSASASFK